MILALKGIRMLLIIGIISVIVFFGCNKDKLGNKEDGLQFNTEEMFRGKVKNFPYVASEGRKEKIIRNYSQLKIGMSKEEVLSILGEPDVEAELFPKYANKPIILGWAWIYYFYKLNSWGQNLVKDQEIYVFFGINKKIDRIEVNNIDQLSGIK